MNRFQVAVVVKMLAVACVIIVLVGLVVISINKVREAAARTQTVNHLKQISLGLHNHSGSFGRLPPATGWPGPPWVAKPKLVEIGTVFVHLIPWIESTNLYRDIIDSEGQILHDNPGVFPPYLSPLDPTMWREDGTACFAANLRVLSTAGLNSKFDGAIDPSRWNFPYGEAKLSDSIPDGTSNTLAFTTIYSECKPGTVTTYFTNAKRSPSPFFGMNAPRFPGSPANMVDQIFQTAPDPDDCNVAWTPQSYNRREILAGLFDGTVTTIRACISPEIWAKLQHPADGDMNLKPWD